MFPISGSTGFLMPDTARAPDERSFIADLEKPLFRAGVADERWRLRRVSWPFALIGVAAKDGAEYVLRFDCNGYPASPPTGRLWDADAEGALPVERWPRSVGGGRVGAVFRADWKAGTALYLPCDREALAGHDAWLTEMPSKIWQPSVGIVHYLELVHELLHSRDYAPPHRAAS